MMEAIDPTTVMTVNMVLVRLSALKIDLIGHHLVSCRNR